MTMYTRAKIRARLKTDVVLFDGKIKHVISCHQFQPVENRYFTVYKKHENIKCSTYNGATISDIVFSEKDIFDDSVSIYTEDAFIELDNNVEFDIKIEYNKKDKHVLNFFREKFNSNSTFIIQVNTEGTIERIYFPEE